jgi:hypothetical protein
MTVGCRISLSGKTPQVTAFTLPLCLLLVCHWPAAFTAWKVTEGQPALLLLLLLLELLELLELPPAPAPALLPAAAASMSAARCPGGQKHSM